jgi:DNA-binding XRE family transcriptional regulator
MKKHALYGRVRFFRSFGCSFPEVASNLSSKTLTAFGRNLVRIRMGKGLTQEGLAEAIDVHPRYLQKLEAGTGHPSLVVMARIRKSLGCEWNDLLQSV